MNYNSRAAQHVVSVLESFLSKKGTKTELIYLIGRAEETDAFTWGQALWFNLQDAPISNDARRARETDEQFVSRSIKYLLSKESPETSAALSDLLDEFESERGEKPTIEAALVSVLRRRKGRL